MEIQTQEVTTTMKESSHFSDDEEEEILNNNGYRCDNDDEDEIDEEDDRAFLLPRETMKRTIREVTESVAGHRMRISGAAFEILREAATGQMIEIFQHCNRLIRHANRNTIMDKDLHLLLDIIRDLYGPSHPLLKPTQSQPRLTLSSKKIVDHPKMTDCIEPRGKAKKKQMRTKKSKPKKKVDVMEIEVVVNQKRKFEEEEEEEEERLKALKREKREEIRKKSKLVQQESMDLIKKYANDPTGFQYELAI